MEHLEYKVEISAPAKKVWETMLQEETYKQWVARSWPNSSYEGKWEQGEKIKFVAAGQGGMLAQLEEVKRYERVFARHIAVLTADGAEDLSSEVAKGLIGTIEEYSFDEHNGKTTLTVSIETTPEWRKMFDDGWPTALEDLKALCEKQMATV